MKPTLNKVHYLYYHKIIRFFWKKPGIHFVILNYVTQLIWLQVILKSPTNEQLLLLLAHELNLILLRMSSRNNCVFF